MKYYGKEKCRILKEIRAEIARKNDIEWVVSECKHQGNCKGTCPRCEQEVRQLEEALARREALGKKVAVVGISASIALSVTGCSDSVFDQVAGGLLPPDGAETAAQTHKAVIEGEMLPPMGDFDPETLEVTAGVPMVPETDDVTMGEPMYPETETSKETETEEETETDGETWPQDMDMGEVPEEVGTCE